MAWSRQRCCKTCRRVATWLLLILDSACLFVASVCRLPTACGCDLISSISQSTTPQCFTCHTDANAPLDLLEGWSSCWRRSTCLRQKQRSPTCRPGEQRAYLPTSQDPDWISAWSPNRRKTPWQTTWRSALNWVWLDCAAAAPTFPGTDLQKSSETKPWLSKLHCYIYLCDWPLTTFRFLYFPWLCKESKANM